MLLTVALAVPESLPAERRHGGGLGRLLRRRPGEVLRSRVFVGHLVVFAFSMGITFAYVATSAFVLQSMNGLSPMLYSVDFAANAVGMTIAALVAARWPTGSPPACSSRSVSPPPASPASAPGRRGVVRRCRWGSRWSASSSS